jgi:transcription-repair coupling factor (superfamily II helicase)
VLLHDIARLAADEPALADLTAPVLGCAEHARAVVLGAIASREDDGTLVVVVPTGTGAAVLADDLARFLGRDDVLLFPAWETLPFERVSPATETMGRRLEVLARLGGAAPPRIVVSSVRAVLQRLAPGTERTEALVVHRGDVLDADTVLERLVAQGYRREPVVEHRGEVARRGSIIDVFPSTGDHPVRIDLWGDEVDRLTAFDVGDQRSTRDLESAAILPAREFVTDAQVRARAAALVSTEPWGREQWERLAEGSVFDGMESWLPWFADDRLLVDVAAAAPHCTSCSSTSVGSPTAVATCWLRKPTSPAHSPPRGPATRRWTCPRCTHRPSGCSPARPPRG